MSEQLEGDIDNPSNREWISTPRPDPTKLTTDQLRRELLMLREFLETRIEGVQRDVDRIAEDLKDGLDYARVLRDEKFSTTKLAIDDCEKRQARALATLCNQFNESLAQKVSAIDERFLIHVRTNELAERTNREAVNAAFAASEKAFNAQSQSFATANAKAEASTAKQLEAIDATIRATVTALNDKIDDIRGRLTTIEGTGKGTRELTSTIFTMGGIAIAAISVVVAVLAFMR